MKVAIASGKGGTGKTFVSTNLFHTFRSMGISVSLVDCDAEVPNSLAFINAMEHKKSDVTQYLPVIDASKCKFCGKCTEYCAYNAIFIAPEMQKICWMICATDAERVKLPVRIMQYENRIKK